MQEETSGFPLLNNCFLKEMFPTITGVLKQNMLDFRRRYHSNGIVIQDNKRYPAIRSCMPFLYPVTPRYKFRLITLRSGFLQAAPREDALAFG